MSGHSKWATIKHKKAALDAKRGQAFTKLIREISVAAKMGGSDPESNARLRNAIITARDANMPKDTMERAIKKGAGELEGSSWEDITYEGYGPAGVAIFVEASTDNKNRTASEIRHLFTKFNGNLGESGCVSWMFHKKGQIFVPSKGVEEDTLMEIALEAGAEDLKNEGEMFVITCDWQGLSAVRSAVEAKKIAVESASVSMIPANTVKVEGKDAETLLKLISALEDNDDVNSVSANFEMDDAMMEKLAG